MEKGIKNSDRLDMIIYGAPGVFHRSRFA